MMTEDDRSSSLKTSRPKLKLEYDASSANEDTLFQNEVLRPILKFQNSILLQTFHHYCKKKKLAIPTDSSESQLLEFVKAVLSKDLPLRNHTIGLVVGLMTMQEHQVYLVNQKSHDKRIIQMLRRRIATQL